MIDPCVTPNMCILGPQNHRKCEELNFRRFQSSNFEPKRSGMQLLNFNRNVAGEDNNFILGTDDFFAYLLMTKVQKYYIKLTCQGKVKLEFKLTNYSSKSKFLIQLLSNEIRFFFYFFHPSRQFQYFSYEVMRISLLKNFRVKLFQ